jgi:hypothetical protein
MICDTFLVLIPRRIFGDSVKSELQLMQLSQCRIFRDFWEDNTVNKCIQNTPASVNMTT